MQIHQFLHFVDQMFPNLRMVGQILLLILAVVVAVVVHLQKYFVVHIQRLVEVMQILLVLQPQMLDSSVDQMLPAIREKVIGEKK